MASSWSSGWWSDARSIGVALGWFVARGYNAYAALIHGRDDGAFYRSTMPWPIGVQEEDEVHWHIPSTVTPRPEATIEDLPQTPSSSRRPRPPTRPQSRLRATH